MPGKNKTKPFYEIEHTADKGLCATGKTIEDLFINMTAGMYYIIYTNTGILNKKKSIGKKIIDLKASSLPDLLVSWLSEINFLLVVENFYLKDIEDLKVIKDNNDRYMLKAKLNGDECADYKKAIRTEIKAVTYHQLKVEQVKNGYTGRVIFDV